MREGVGVAVADGVGVAVGEDVGVRVAVGVGLGVGTTVGVAVGVGVGTMLTGAENSEVLPWPSVAVAVTYGPVRPPGLANTQLPAAFAVVVPS